MDIRLLVFSSSVLLRISFSIHIKSTSTVQVPNTVLSKFSLCTLTVFPMPTRTRIQSLGCSSICSLTPSCNLACFNGSSCLLSSALVAPYWVPKASVIQTLLPLTDYTCYSSWVFQNDLTSKIFSVSASPTYSNEHHASYAVDGYFCNTWGDTYEAAININNWFEIDMGKAYSILKIVVKIRGYTADGVYFSNVWTGVGNASGKGNYGSFSTLGNFVGNPQFGQVISFQSTAPIVGRYIGLQDYKNEYFTIGEVKIIGFEI